MTQYYVVVNKVSHLDRYFMTYWTTINSRSYSKNKSNEIRISFNLFPEKLRSAFVIGESRLATQQCMLWWFRFKK